MYFQEILQKNLMSLFGFAGNTKIDPILREILSCHRYAKKYSTRTVHIRRELVLLLLA
jgi:hypothetical protein